jgi:hypothetical protein
MGCKGVERHIIHSYRQETAINNRIQLNSSNNMIINSK